MNVSTMKPEDNVNRLRKCKWSRTPAGKFSKCIQQEPKSEHHNHLRKGGRDGNGGRKDLATRNGIPQVQHVHGHGSPADLVRRCSRQSVTVSSRCPPPLRGGTRRVCHQILLSDKIWRCTNRRTSTFQCTYETRVQFVSDDTLTNRKDEETF